QPPFYADELRREMEAEGEEFDSTSDSEILARILVRELPHGPDHAVGEVMRRCRGAYSVTVLTPRMILGFRDPWGIRPLTAGLLGEGFMVASETCAFGPVGGVPTREMKPGELVVITAEGMRFVQAAPPEPEAMCLFEMIYFARPDSVMFGKGLYGVRERMGENLASEWPADADIVVPVPDSGVPAALGYARATGIPYREGMTSTAPLFSPINGCANSASA
ncbi:MAG: hypothetical protein C4320_07130, partial [Armatimonadota bacterium]